MDGQKPKENAAARRGYARVCFILGWVLAAWCVLAVVATYETQWPLASSLFDGAFTAEAVSAALELLGYVLGFIAGLCAVDGTRPQPTAIFRPFPRAVLAACLAWAGALCMPAAGMAHVSSCLTCTSLFTSFSPGMWTQLIVMAIGGAAFTVLAVLRAKDR